MSNATPITVVTSGNASLASIVPPGGGRATPVVQVDGGNATPVILVAQGSSGAAGAAQLAFDGVQLDPAFKGVGVIISGGGLTATFTDEGLSQRAVRASVPIYPGQKKFFSMVPGQVGSEVSYSGLGLAVPGYPVSLTPAESAVAYLGLNSSLGGFDDFGGVTVNGVDTFALTALVWALGNTVDFAVDTVNWLFWFRVNGGAWNGALAGNPTTGTGGLDMQSLRGQTLYPYFSGGVVSPAPPNITTVNFAGPFPYAMPSGFSVIDPLQTVPAAVDDVLAWKNAVIAAGGTVSGAQETRITTLINAFKAAGVWTGLDRFWLHASENAQQATIDLKVRQPLQLIAAPAFTVNRGYKGNGTTQWLTTFTRAMAYAGSYMLDNACMGTWVVIAPTIIARGEIGNDDSSYSWIQSNVNGTQSTGAVNSTAGGPVVNHAGIVVGQYHAQRVDSTTLALYKNGALAVSAGGFGTQGSAATFKILGVPNAADTGVGKLSDSQVGVSYIGRAMTAPEITAFYNAMRTYMTAVGVP